MNNLAWMYERFLPCGEGFNLVFFNGVDEFVDFATSQVDFMDEGKIKCPCTRCHNCKYDKSDNVKEHIYRNGFVQDYYWWTVKAKNWPKYFVGRYIFHTLEHGDGKSTMNRGVCVKGSSNEKAHSDFYGILEEIIELDYSGSSDDPLKVVLFKGLRFDPMVGMKVHPDYQIVEINHKKNNIKNIAQQALQVYYAEYPGAKKGRMDWWVVCKTVSRSRIEERWTYVCSSYQPDEIGTSELNAEIEEMPPDLRYPTGSFDLIDDDDTVEFNQYVDEDEELFNTPDTTIAEESAQEEDLE